MPSRLCSTVRCDSFRLSDALRALGAERDVTFDLVRRILIEYPKRIQLRVFRRDVRSRAGPLALCPITLEVSLTSTNA
jgi:hypothetical protein